MKNSIYSHGLDKNPANHVAQTPLTFIERSARVYPNHTAVLHFRRGIVGEIAYRLKIKL